MILVMMAVALAATLSVGFLASQGTAAGISMNVNRHARARVIAESGLSIVAQHVRDNDNWRTDYTHGSAWVDAQAFGGGTFTVYGEDGEDLDGDGSIGTSGTEGDGDLTDDETDVLTLTSVGTYQGVTHTVEAVITPGGDGDEFTGIILFAVGNGSSPETDDTKKAALFESWGYTVEYIDDNASLLEYTTALATASVAYISETCSSGSIGTKLTSTTVGVVCEEGYCNDALEVTSQDSGSTSSNVIDIVDNSHYITSVFSTGTLAIVSPSQSMRTHGGTMASGATVLAEKEAASNPMLVVVDTGDTLENSTAALGRRVLLPVSMDDFDFDDLTSDGQTLLQRAINWAADNTGSGSTSLTGIDIGDVGIAGSSANASGTWTINASGSDIWGTSDEFHFVYTTQSGDGVLSAQVESMEYTDEWAKAGVMIRETLDADSRYAYMMLQPTGGWAFQRRTSTASYADSTQSSGVSPPAFVKVERAGDVFTGYTSSTGADGTWTQRGTVTMSGFASDAYIGLAVTSHNDGELNTSVISSVVLNGSSAGEGSSSGEGPTLIAEYDFESVAVSPVLVGHWKLDDSGNGAVMAFRDRIGMYDDTRIDSYRSSAGAYGGSNIRSNAQVHTDKTDSNNWQMSGTARVSGDAYVGSGGNAYSVISTSGSSSITGSKSAHDSDNGAPSFSEPGGFSGSIGSQSISSGTQTVSSDYRASNISIYGGTINISGDVRVLIDGDFYMSGGTINVPDGSSLYIYCKGKFTIKNSASINADSEGTDRFTLHMPNHDERLYIEDSAEMAGVFKIHDDVNISENAVVYGNFYVRHDLSMSDDAQVHLDESLESPIGGGATSASDEVSGNDGSYGSSPSTGQSGFGDGGTSYRFDGNNDYVEIPHDSSYMIDEGAISFWFRADDTSGVQGLFTKDSNGYDNGGHVRVYTDGSRVKVRIQSTTTSYDLSSSNNVFSSGSWTHVAFTFGPSGCKLYVDGDLEDTNSYTGGLGTSSGGSGNNEPIAIGVDTDNSSNQSTSGWDSPFEGKIDEVRLYSTQLDATQVDNLANGDEPGDANGSLVQDTSGYGTALDLTITDPGNVTWLSPSGLQIDSGTTIIDDGSNTKIYTALTTSNEYSIELKFQVDSTNGNNKVIAGYGNGSSRNFRIGAESQAVEWHNRTSTTGSGGEELDSTNILNTSDTFHVIISYDGTTSKIYYNDVANSSESLSGDLSTWSSGYRFTLGDMYNGSSNQFVGTLRRVAIYDGAFDDSQAENVFDDLEPGAGSGSGSGGTGDFYVRWVESP